MKTITVNTSNNYKIIIDKNILSTAGDIAAKEIGVSGCAVITDSNVDKLYSSTLIASLESAGYKVSKFVFEAGEQSKNANTFIDILEFLASCELTRSDCIFALGGGVVGDIAGFAASVYLRGIKYVQIPTTLLAMVDSSVGGKTGIDLNSGKNLAGAFHQPSLVICDTSLLNTLPTEIFSDGCAEVIKYGIINDTDLISLINSGIRENIDEIVASCVNNKRLIVEKDEFDNGCRQLLNLGHTVGHAIEKCSDFNISHGSAVAIGMVVMMTVAVNSDLCDEYALEELIKILKENNLPTECSYTAKQLASVALSDKKRKGNTITLAIPYNVSDTRLVDISVDELEAFIERGLDR